MVTIDIFDVTATLEDEKLETITNIDLPDWKWTSTEVVSTESTNDSVYSVLDVDAEGNVYIAWEDGDEYDATNIFFKYWNGTTQTWGITEVISTETPDTALYPALAVDAVGNVHVVWSSWTDYAGSGADTDIFYKRWEADSESWTVTEVVSTESTDESYHPSLAVDAVGNVHVVWEDWTNYLSSGSDWDIFYKCWNASASSWTTTEVVSTESSAFSLSASLAVDATGNLHVAWQDQTDYAEAGTDTDIFYKCWNATISSWTTTEVVSTDNTGGSLYPSLAVDAEGNVHIAWEDNTNVAYAGTDYDIFYKRKEESTSSWTVTKVVSPTSSSSYYSALAVDTMGNVHIAWEDNTDILYRRWEESTSSWTTTEKVSSESSGDACQPALAIDTAGSVHIAWEDNTDYIGAGTDIDIFYKKFFGPPAAPELAFIVPNPSTTGEITLNWDDVSWASEYLIYRSSSYIWSISEFSPIDSTTENLYIDDIEEDGYYYYVIVSNSFIGNSSISNCQFVEVRLTGLSPPELAYITPNPCENEYITLDWSDVEDALEYYIYRSDSYIWSVDSLTPIYTTDISIYLDTLPSEGHFFYVVVATDGLRNSTISNCQYVFYEVPHLREFGIITSLIAGTAAISFIVFRKRRKQ